MRFRRLRKGRREPLYWSRVASNWSVDGDTDNMNGDLGDAIAGGGLVLWDGQASQFSTAEGRVTVRKVLFPSSYVFAQDSVQAIGGITYQVHLVCIKTGTPLADLVSTSYTDLLQQEDVMWSSAMTFHVFVGNTVGVVQDLNWQDFQLNVQRKLDISDKIIVLGFTERLNGPLGASIVTSLSLGTQVSVLWQRSLR